MSKLKCLGHRNLLSLVYPILIATTSITVQATVQANVQANVQVLRADIIYCDSPTLELPSGYYARDFLLLSAAHPQLEWVKPNNIKQIFYYNFAAINQLSRIVDLSYDFFDYSHGFLRPDQSKKNHLWEEAAFGYEPITRANLGQKILSLCPGQNTLGHEAVRHTFSTGKRIYNFVPQALALLGPNDNLQKSFVLLREWLENHSLDDSTIQSLLSFYHRKGTIEQLKTAKSLDDLQGLTNELRSLFHRLLAHPRPAENSICHRSLAVVHSLERALSNRCDKIQSQDLAKLKSLQIIDPRIPNKVIEFYEFEFRRGDFSGLTNLEELNLTQLPWLGTSIKSGLLGEVPQVKRLLLSRSYLRNLWPEIFFGLNELEFLEIDHNPFIDNLAPDVFNGIFAKNVESRLSLKGIMNSKQFTSSILSGLENLQHLDLSENQNSSFGTRALRHLKGLKSLKLSSEGDFSKNADSVNPVDLPKLEELHLGSYPYPSIPELPHLRTLRIDYAYIKIREDFAAKFPRLEELDLSNSAGLFFVLPHNFTELNHFRVYRANGVANALMTETWSASAKALPESTELVEYCHPQADRVSFRYLAQEIFRHHKNIRLRSRFNCQGDWHELQN